MATSSVSMYGFEEGSSSTSLGFIHFIHRKGGKNRILLLHGLGATISVWNRIMEFFPNDYDIYAIDLLGHGKSDKPLINYKINVQAKAVNEFITNKCEEGTFLMGHSYGAWVALECASNNKVKGIIVEDGTVLEESMEEKPKFAKPYKEKLLKELLMINNNERNVMESILEDYYEKEGMEASQLSKIKTKTLIIWGSKDDVVDASYAMKLHDVLKNSTLAIIDGAGHEPHYSNPKETVAEITKFISGINESKNNS